MRLEWRGVTKKYGEKTAVDSLDLTAQEGELLVLVGPSGCGKTTTLTMANRLTEPTSGCVLVDGEEASGIPPVELRRRMGYVIQQVGLFPHMTVAENIASVPKLLGWDRGAIARRVEEMLDLIGLAPGEYSDAWPSTLSGGEAQRVGVARALAADPPILLMDEPFGAVDPLTRETLQREFLRIRSTLGTTVVLVTHDLDEAIRLGDRIAVMNEGRLVIAAPPGEILSSGDSFVRDFTGDDRALRGLMRIGVVHAMVPVVPPVGTVASVSAGATLREALSKMLETGETTLAVLDSDGRPAGVLGLEDLVGRSFGKRS